MAKGEWVQTKGGAYRINNATAVIAGVTNTPQAQGSPGNDGDFDLIIYGGGYRAEAWLTDDPIKPMTGYGGHPIGSRPKRKSLTVYEGRQPFSLEVPVLLWRGGASIEADRIALDEMATAEGEHPGDEPPTVEIEARFPLPIPPKVLAGGVRWWVENLEWKDEVRLPPSEGGHLVRKLVTVTLLEAVAEQLLGEHPAGTKGHQNNDKWEVKQKHSAKKGTPETLHEVAVNSLHPKGQKEVDHVVEEIRKLNSKDGHHVSYKIGTKLIVPGQVKASHPKKAKK